MVITNVSNKGKFIISLDFELYWGVMDSRGEDYFSTLRNVPNVCERLLSLFREYEISCTWAAVGALCAENINELSSYFPEERPTYQDVKQSPYERLKHLEVIDHSLIFAPDIINKILTTPNQELGSHTFSHYYTLEAGQTIEQFEDDLKSYKSIIDKYSTRVESIIFPRNQINQDYLRVCAKYGFLAYRGNPKHWAYQSELYAERSILRRCIRLLDSYIPISGSLMQAATKDLSTGLINIPASIFFRPYNTKFFFLEKLKLWRLKNSMLETAKKGGVFHLWWHPHNFGSNLEANLDQIEELFKYYKFLSKNYDFESVTMSRLANEVQNNNSF